MHIYAHICTFVARCAAALGGAPFLNYVFVSSERSFVREAVGWPGSGSEGVAPQQGAG